MTDSLKNRFFGNGGDSSGVMLPVLPLRDTVIFPYMVAPLFAGRAKSVTALVYAMGRDKTIFLTTQKEPAVDNPKEKDISEFGTIATILQILRLPDGTAKILLEGRARARILQLIEKKEFMQAEVQPVEDTDVDPVKSEAMGRAIIKVFEEYAKTNTAVPMDIVRDISNISDVSQMADAVSAHFSFKFKDRLELLETVSLEKRLDLLLSLVKREIEIFKVNSKLRGMVQKQMDQTQKKYYLNEQIRAIKKEMGTDDEDDPGEEMKELEKNLKKKKLPKEAQKKAKQELKKLKLMPPMSAEATVVRNYLDWILDLPWNKKSRVNKNIDKAEKILNEDHYGLDKPKERILEYLAVQTLTEKVRGPILCMVGPPGVGKTSLAKSIARATGRKFVRLSLGGVRDEAEIRGHRRTYIGAMPGKIIQSLKKVGVTNPVFCLDEVDKMSMDFRGDPSSALLEVLDSEQNNTFNDHYLDLDYDLSDIMFITTANTLDEIPLPLQDRMEVIRLHGYTEHEKYKIASLFLTPKQIKLNGLKKKRMDVTFSKGAIMTVIQRYTREAGVRNLERETASICRKIAKRIVKDKKAKGKKAVSVKVTSTSVKGYLGTWRYKHGQVEDKDQIGIVTGLAWTQVGGELLSVETLIIPGKGQLILTGKLGDVMKESAKAAVSYVRSRSDSLSIKDDFYKNYDIHIHVPEGAIPKDGPSAGIAMCTSLVSVLTKRPVLKDIAMTGEITLRGRVLEIGGLKEKILAAHRGGIKKVLIPGDNEKNLEDISKKIKAQVEIIPIMNMDEVIPHALVAEAE